MREARWKLPRLGDLELAVLDHLWRVPEADVHETHAAVGKTRGISPNTVGSALERLHKKGLLGREKISHAYRYRALLNREAFRARRVVEVVADSDEAALVELERLVRMKREESGS
jgi:predicted transcriptional regulator